jgi:hypothetical protein
MVHGCVLKRRYNIVDPYIILCLEQAYFSLKREVVSVRFRPGS